MNVQAPDGRTWTVKRRWFPRRRRIGRADLDHLTPDWLDFGSFADDLSGILLGIVVGIVAFVLVLVLFNVVAIAIELVLLILLLFAGLFGRVVLRRPWIVQARSGDAELEWPVVGWGPSGRKIAEVAEQLRSGAQLDAPRQHR